MSILGFAGDALWVIALSIMASSSRAAWRRIDPLARVPLLFDLKGRPLARARRGLALSLAPAIAFLAGIALVVFNRQAPGSGDEAMILFGVRATLAAMFALFHLRWLGAAMDALDKEGALKP